MISSLKCGKFQRNYDLLDWIAGTVALKIGKMRWNRHNLKYDTT